MLNLDTHILVHALFGEPTRREHDLLTAHRWGISTIVLWELAKLVQLGRLELNLEDPEVRRAIQRLHTWPITLSVCGAIEQLDFVSDPADEIIASTSLVHGAPLLTRDRKILGSGVVPLA